MSKTKGRRGNKLSNPNIITDTELEVKLIGVFTEKWFFMRSRTRTFLGEKMDIS